MMAALQTWAARHAQTAIGTLGRLSQQWLPSSFMVLVIGIALTLPACLQVVLVNARLASGDWNRAVEISVYFKSNATLPQVEQLAATLRRRSDIADVRVISADAALAEFRKQSGFGEAIASLNENPLPHAIVVRPVADATRGTALIELADELGRADNVDMAQLDAAWVERFNAILEILNRAAAVIGTLLALAVVVIVGNAIRADIQSRREEIEVSKLVGGSDAFVRRPFLYTGIWYGLAGGALALAMTLSVVAILNRPVKHLATLYGSPFELSGLGFINALIVLGAGVGLGWLGSFLAATRHLRQIEPR
jgi:cell division transport system permease protein